MTPLIICCINNCDSEKLCFCTKCSVDVNFQTLDFLSFLTRFKDLNSTIAKRGSVFIGIMTPDGAIWFRYQKVVSIR